MVVKSHRNLFKSAVPDGSVTYMTNILNRVWPSKKEAPKLHLAYAISVCDFFLDPANQKIQVSEAAIKFKMNKYLRRLTNKEKLNSDDDEEITVEPAIIQEGEREVLEGGQEEGEEENQEGDVQEGVQEGYVQEGDVQGEDDDDYQEVVIQEEGGEDVGGDEYYSSEEEKRKAESLRVKYSKKY